eukprot:CCRYP_019604-RA/>CCRYP_019604-RA protein AED:0.10 eAED:-0.11 QI:0/0/0/1/1/1/2/0/230
MTISGAALYQFAIRQGSSAFTSCKNPSRKIFASPGARIMFAPLKASLEEGEDELDYISPMRQRPRPKGGDVAYTNENILRQQSTYYSIRSAGGADCVVDIYARDPSTSGSKTRFWFVGKVARCTGTVSEEAAVVRQYNLIEEHACRIRPVELGRSFGKLELYVAPGDTERDTNRDDPTIRLRKFPRNVDGAETVPLLEVGVNLEIVTNQGVGFHIVRTEDGVVPPDMIGQ